MTRTKTILRANTKPIPNLILLLNISWNANLISYLATHSIQYPFDRLETLLSTTDLKIAVLPGSAHQDNFALSAKPMQSKAWKKRIEPFLDEYKPYQGIHCRMREKSSMFLSAVLKN